MFALCVAHTRARIYRRHLLLLRVAMQYFAPAGFLIFGACHDLAGRSELPAGTISPSAYNTAAGAEALRARAIGTLQSAIPVYILETGLLTDELRTSETVFSPGVLIPPASISIDSRLLPSSGVSSYAALQAARADASLALQALAAWDTSRNTPRLRAEMFGLMGYIHILLADFFCSGIPLSTIDLREDFTYRAGSTTAEVYRLALANLDSALVLADTDSQLLNLARVLKGRALLALDSAAAAGQVSTAVPTTFRYQLALRWTSSYSAQNNLNGQATIADREGQNGLPYLSDNDPRTMAVLANNQNNSGIQLLFPAKYSETGFSAFPVADGIEARLIEAEALLRAGDIPGMLDVLNALRRIATVAGQTESVPDTLHDPGSQAARIALLFQERAYWLFLTGHREGDLRRVLRQYRQWYPDQRRVYPTGSYTVPGFAPAGYGKDVNASIDPQSEAPNPLFHGCLNRDP